MSITERCYGRLFAPAEGDAQQEWIGAAVVALGERGEELASAAREHNKARERFGFKAVKPVAIRRQALARELAPVAAPADMTLLGRRSELEPAAFGRAGSIPLGWLSRVIAREQIRLGLARPFPAVDAGGSEIDWCSDWEAADEMISTLANA